MQQTFRCTYVGDPLSGKAFALIGARNVSPELTAEAVRQAVNTARADSNLVLIETEYAALLDEELRDTIVTDPVPPIVIVPSLTHDGELVDVTVREARAVLGIDT